MSHSPGLGMNRRFRLASSSDIKRVRRAGKSYAHPLAVLVAHRSDLPTTRCAVTATRSVGSAVARNRAKRRLREALRFWIPRAAPGWELLLIARPPAVTATWKDVQAAVETLLRRARVIEVENEPSSTIPG